MVAILANGLVVAGTCILVLAFVPLRKLAQRLPAGRALRHWRALAVLNAFFVAGYAAYATIFWGRHDEPTSLIVPSIFFLGACFVWLTCSLALQTALDLQRMPLLEVLATIDNLTKLPNRALFDERLQQAILIGQREKRAFALIAMDLNRFKEINDTLGHHVGDQVLQHVAACTRACLRESDTVARMGGDEFTILLATARDADGAVVVAKKIQQALSAPFEAAGRSLQIGASLGMAMFPQHGEDAASLLRNADAAMYAAKQWDGGYRVYSEEKPAAAHAPLPQRAERPGAG